ncbi:Hypothetical protein A7982_07762 [Minicystis rosea]|nr:Hypothetical protein A7982_07762 [Minicystis rosea]
MLDRSSVITDARLAHEIELFLEPLTRSVFGGVVSLGRGAE